MSGFYPQVFHVVLFRIVHTLTVLNEQIVYVNLKILKILKIKNIFNLSSHRKSYIIDAQQ